MWPGSFSVLEISLKRIILEIFSFRACIVVENYLFNSNKSETAIDVKKRTHSKGLLLDSKGNIGRQCPLQIYSAPWMNGLTEINRPSHHCAKGAIYVMKKTRIFKRFQNISQSKGIRISLRISKILKIIENLENLGCVKLRNGDNLAVYLSRRAE